MKSILEDFSQSALFESIGDICAAVNTTLDGQELLDVSLKKLVKLLDASRGSIYILRENSKDLILESAYGFSGHAQRDREKKLGEGILGMVAQSKESIYVSDITADKRFEGFKSRGNYKTSSFICAPLMIRDQLIGVINITDKESGRSFSKEEMQLVDFLTNQIALNYRRIQLYKKFKDVIKETQSLKDKLGETDREARQLKQQVVINEKLATIGKLAGGIAHEFNNPLDGVMRYTNLSLDNLQDNDVVRGYLLEIKQGLKRMANIVSNLLACSRSDVLSEKTVNITQAVERVIAAVRINLLEKNVEISCNIADNIPDIVDLGIERVFSNLIRNAIDAIDEQGEVAIAVFLDEDDVVIEVKDSGKGIAQEHINQIFEPFFTTKDIEKGCGLGLTIVGEVIKSYEGQVQVESSKETGTKFIIRLPVG